MRLRVGSALLGAIVLAVVVAGQATGAIVDVASDSFARTRATGWGTADTGGAWSLDGAASSFSVTPGAGKISLSSPGGNRAAFLNAVSVRDASIRVQFQLSTLTGGSTYVYATLRHTATTELRVKVRIGPSGAAFVQATRVSNGTETDEGAEAQLSSPTIQAGKWYWLRADALGNPATLRARVWGANSGEPSTWQVNQPLSVSGFGNAGGVGLRAYRSRTATGNVEVSFGKFSSSNLSAPNPTPTSTPSPAHSPPPPPDSIVLAGAGDIARCGTKGSFATAALLASMSGMVFTAGDNAYPDGTAADFACYDQSWGQFNSRVLPVPGNHEYITAGASGYYNYFGTRAGKAGLGYYAREVGSWRIYALNSQCGAPPMVDCSAEAAWLRADLAANPHACVAAIWHDPRFNSGDHGDNTAMGPFWQALYNAGAEIVINGHAHDYERFAPMDPTGTADSAAGIREIIAGTGGIGEGTSFVKHANSVVFNPTASGVLKLTLRTNGYDWQFIPVAGQTFTDSGSGSCH